MKKYFIVYLALMILLGLTWGSAYLDLGALNTSLNIGIAIMKALLVLLVFMHIRWSSGLVRLFSCAGFFWLVIMLSLAMSDYLTRNVLR